MNFSIVNKNINDLRYDDSLARPEVGGVVIFEGRVRNHNEDKPVSSLEYEAYQGLAEKEGQKIIAEALARFDVRIVQAVHRTGHLQIGDVAVWVVAAADHRKEAFLACEYIINEIKDRVPIWKKEHYVNGEAKWVRCDRCAGHSHHHDHQQDASIQQAGV